MFSWDRGTGRGDEEKKERKEKGDGKKKERMIRMFILKKKVTSSQKYSCYSL